jgi:hypothetical protein
LVPTPGPGRTSHGKRYFRQKYKDPFTREDFVVIRALIATGITDVHGSSGAELLKQANFPEQYNHIEGKKRYGGWRFIYVSSQGLKPPGLLTIPARKQPESRPAPRKLPH